MKVYAFVGPSGTGKSYRAQMVASEKGINFIIDDGLLIKDNQVIAGVSAKKAPTKIETVKHALFYSDEEKKPIQDTLKKYKPSKILILGDLAVNKDNLLGKAKKMGIKVIAMSSLSYAKSVDPVHSSGQKLIDFVDLTLDNCAPAAEAMLEVEGIEANFAAASGIASSYILWSVTAVVLEEMQNRGMDPLLLKSANYPGGPEYNNGTVRPRYWKQGY